MAINPECRKWLIEQCCDVQSHTHSSLKGQGDETAPTGRWKVTPATEDSFHGAIAEYYKNGKPMYCVEKFTSTFNFCLDVELEGADFSDAELQKILPVVSGVLAKLFPESKQNVVVLTASGKDKSANGDIRGSFHFIWPDIHVNSGNYTICWKKIISALESSPVVKAMHEAKIQGLPGHNAWADIVDGNLTSLRMAFCDKWVPLKGEAAERPMVPKLEVEYTVSGDGVPRPTVLERFPNPPSRADMKKWLQKSSVRYNGSPSIFMNDDPMPRGNFRPSRQSPANAFERRGKGKGKSKGKGKGF